MTSIRLEVRIRRALPEEANVLTELIMRAKGYWGYDQSFLELSRPVLMLTSESIERDPVHCAEVGDTIAGVSHLQRVNEAEACLVSLFVEPAFIGQGIGGLLWRHVVDLARSMGARSLVFDADPHALPFYEHMGAVVEGYMPSEVLAERMLPFMRYQL